jgi:hypothetical protein
MIVKTKLVGWFGASAITVFPFIFIAPDVTSDPQVYASTLKHENVHIGQQKRWAIYGLGVGLLAWFFCYELLLPVGWNPFRRKWETAAYEAEGYTIDQINVWMKEAPYYLWWG